MLRLLVLGTALSVLLTSAADAGGIDWSGQPSGLLFEEGRYAELSFRMTSPSVSGTDIAGQPTGDVTNTFFLPSLGYKADLSPALSYAVMIDRPFGASVDYGGSSPVFGGTSVDATFTALTGLLRYKINEGISVFGGLRAQTVSADITLNGAAFGPLAGYAVTTDNDTGLGYVGGVAYEIPRIALRAALTYNSEIRHDVTTRETIAPGESRTRITTPQSINLDVQTGIARDTLVFGSVRWVDWSSFDVAPAALLAASGSSLVSYENDTFTYTLGVGRQFSKVWSGAVQVSYDTEDQTLSSALGPTNGFVSLGAGVTYQMNRMQVTGGIAYAWLGDADVDAGGASGATFTDDTAVGISLQIGYSF